MVYGSLVLPGLLLQENGKGIQFFLGPNLDNCFQVARQDKPRCLLMAPRDPALEARQSWLHFYFLCALRDAPQKGAI